MRIILVIFIFLILGCNNREEKLSQLKQLQNVFGTANWRIVKGNDTSYIFFSPQSDNSSKIYHYTLFKGDSANTEMGSIKENNGKISWTFFDRILVLDYLKSSEIKWKDNTVTSYVLKKQDDSTMYIRSPRGDIQFKKTLPISTFLVRVKYDYEHGSKLADSTEIKPRTLIRY